MELLDQQWLSSALATAPSVAADEQFTVSLTLSDGKRTNAVSTWTVANGAVSAAASLDGEPDLALVIPPTDARAVASGALQPAAAYMQGKLKATGDMALMLRLVKSSGTPTFDVWRSQLPNVS